MNRSEVMIATGLREEVGIAGHAHRQREGQARPVTYPQPSHHATMPRRVQGMPKGWTARVLVLRRRDGSVEIYGSLLAYMRAHPARSATWQNDAARALGLFWDYSCATGMAPTSSALGEGAGFVQDHFRAFALALLKGTITDGRDPLGLYWPSSSRSVARKMVRKIEDFAQWCEHRSGRSTGRNPLRPPDDGLTFTDILVWSRLRKVGMLSHLDGQPRKLRRESVVDLGRDARGHDLEAAKFFPREHAGRLIWEGHRRPRANSGVLGTYNVRDQMMALLDGWGGLRQSEGLHLWVNDVVENSDKPGHAVVVLYHPTEAKVAYVDPISGRPATDTRAEVLNRIFGLQARNEVKRGRYHVGWKGMDLDRNHRAIVHWADDNAAKLFWALYLTYLHERKRTMDRRRSMGGRDHPFLLLSEGEDRNADRAEIGAPYSLQAYERNHKAAVRRIGLPYRKDAGTTTHGLRHMYGRTLADLRLPPGIIRKAMHHVSPLSQLVYVAPDNGTTDARLSEAWARLTSGQVELVGAAPAHAALDPAALSNDTTLALLRLRASITGGGGIA